MTINQIATKLAKTQSKKSTDVANILKSLVIFDANYQHIDGNDMSPLFVLIDESIKIRKKQLQLKKK